MTKQERAHLLNILEIITQCYDRTQYCGRMATHNWEQFEASLMHVFQLYDKLEKAFKPFQSEYNLAIREANEANEDIDLDELLKELNEDE